MPVFFFSARSSADSIAHGVTPTSRHGARVLGNALTSLVMVLVAASAVLMGTPGALARQFEVSTSASAKAGEPVKDPVTIRAVAREKQVAQGGRVVVAVEINHAEHYHTWPETSVKLPDALDFARRTRVSFPQNDDSAEIRPAFVAGSTVQYPVAKPGKVGDPDGGPNKIEVPLYSGRAVAFLTVQFKADAPLGEQKFEIEVYSQACDDQVCLQPATVLLPVSVTVGPKDSAASLSPAAQGPDKDLFTTYDEAKANAALTAMRTPEAGPRTGPASGATSGGTSNAGTPAPGSSSAPTAGNATFFGLNLGSGVVLLGLFAALGGFLLNLTPCVLPVIPIKVMSLTSHAKSRSRAIVLAIWMALGVVMFWTIIGMPMAFISAALDPSRFIFGVWWITLAIAVVIALFGLGIMGLFSITLPQSVYSVETKADSAWGSFLLGVFTAVLGLPCFGFVAGGLLAGAATLPAASIMTIFLGLGVGMAAPYLVLSIWPKLLEFIPRTGPASELVKQVMGLLLLAASAFFVAAGIKAAISDYPFLTGSIGWWAVGFFVLVAALWMCVRTFQISKKPVPRLIMPVIGLVMVLGIGVFANNQFADDRANYTKQQAALSGNTMQAGVIPGVWSNYSPALFDAHRASGKAVFLEFTAEWCINCKVLRRALLDQEPLKSELARPDLALLEVDCTSNRAPGWKKLEALQRTGIPTWVVYGPGQTEPVIIDLTTPTRDTIRQALAKAGLGPKPTTPQAAAPQAGTGSPAGGTSENAASEPIRSASR